ncbi:hypothetical protein NDU88_004202 [Pleurodeles waltl]|uniref:Uncharacterized protein n=1 Tax=Pleurodeles waltl TaxID=8319 RepID=A0AAV7UFF7_PLEWA|nr:hypothetical protein NDU88_004202 [Pleurodeles waltl]
MCLRQSTFGFERAGLSTKEDQKHEDQTALVIYEDGQTGVAAERAGILDPATHNFEQAHMSRSRKTRHLDSTTHRLQKAHVSRSRKTRLLRHVTSTGKCKNKQKGPGFAEK